MKDVKIRDTKKADIKISDAEKNDVMIPDTSCRNSGENTFEAEKNDRSAAAPDCVGNGTTSQIYDVT